MIALKRLMIGVNLHLNWNNSASIECGLKHWISKEYKVPSMLKFCYTKWRPKSENWHVCKAKQKIKGFLNQDLYSHKRSEGQIKPVIISIFMLTDWIIIQVQKRSLNIMKDTQIIVTNSFLVPTLLFWFTVIKIIIIGLLFNNTENLVCFFSTVHCWASSEKQT